MDIEWLLKSLERCRQCRSASVAISRLLPSRVSRGLLDDSLHSGGRTRLSDVGDGVQEDWELLWASARDPDGFDECPSFGGLAVRASGRSHVRPYLLEAICSFASPEELSREAPNHGVSPVAHSVYRWQVGGGWPVVHVDTPGSIDGEAISSRIVALHTSGALPAMGRIRRRSRGDLALQPTPSANLTHDQSSGCRRERAAVVHLRLELCAELGAYFGDHVEVLLR